MLRFKVYQNGKPTRQLDLRQAFLIGSDRVPLRGEVKMAGGELVCESRSRGAAALAILWPVEGVGRVMLETPRLLERKRPYVLNVELARGLMMRICQKREDWGLYDFPDGKELYAACDTARDQLVEAIAAPDEHTAAQRGDAAISASVKVGERLGVFHADVFLRRRRTADQFAKRPLGCAVDPSTFDEARAQRLAKAFDFVSVPMSWRQIEPVEGKPQWDAIEQAIKLARKHKTAAWGGRLLGLSPALLPDWVAKSADRYDWFREAAARHLKALLKQFGSGVHGWEATFGLHATNPFGYSFEQIMELTRLGCTLVKQVCPRSISVLGITMPWGEYYARDHRTIPPVLYAEMAVQAGISFDAFGIEVRFGGKDAAQCVRDMMQVSSMLDRFGTLGKPLHVLASGVPSAGEAGTQGWWRGDWSEQVQAQWLQEFYRVALSKPFVETVTWQALADGSASPAGGLLKPDLSPKAGFEALCQLRQGVLGL